VKRSDDERASAPTELSSREVPAASAELPIVDPGRYHRGGEVGRGGLGRVTRADDSRFGRTVAIKELRLDRADARSLLLREALLTAKLQHPGVAPIYDAGYWPDGSPFYAMKLIEGQTLGALVASASTPVQRLALLPHVIAVADTIAYAHSRGVVHRDIKPANVVVGPYGETVVLDWGIALRAGGDGPTDAKPNGDSVIDSGGVAGTVGYMAPEQERGQPIDARADVFALGACLFHVLAGAPPGATDPPSVAPDLQAILDKALAPDPMNRYADAGAMASDLRRFSAGQLVSAHHYDLRSLIARWLRRHRAVVTVAVILVVLLAALGVYTITNKLASRARDAERTRVLTLLQARSSMASDGAHAIAWLKTLSSDELGPPRILAAAANSRGVARTIWLAHQNSIHDMEVSRDGTVVATASRDRTARLFDVTRGTTVDLVGHSDEIFAIAFDAEGDHVATASADGTARVWDLGGHEIWRVGIWAIAGEGLRPDLKDAILHVELLDHGGTLVTGDRQGRIALTKNGHEPVILARVGSQIENLWFGDHGRIVAARGTDEHGVDGAVMIVRLDGSGVVRLDAKAANVGVVAWLGDRLATGYERTVTVWSSTGSRLEQLVLEADVSRLVIDGDRVLIGDVNGGVHIWAPGRDERKLPGPSSRVLDLAAVAPDKILTGNADGRLSLYDFKRGVVVTMRGHDGAVDHVRVARGSLVSTGVDGTLRLWPEEPPVTVMSGADSAVDSFAAEPGGTVAIGREDGSVDLFPGGRVAPPGKPKFDVAISGVARRVAYSYDHGVTVVGWDGSPVGSFPLDGHLGFLAWSRDGSMLAASSSTERIVIYDSALRLVRELRIAGNVEARVAFSPDGHLVSAGWDGSVRSWDVSTGESRLLGRHDGSALGIAISSDGKLVASVGADGVILLHDVDSGTSRTLGRQNGALNRVAFSPDNQTVVTAGRDLALGVWRVDGTGGRLLRGHNDAVTTLCLSPDGQLAATAARDGTVRLWDLASGESATLENVGKAPIAAWFLDSGTRLITAAGDGSVRTLALDMPGTAGPFRAWLDKLTTFTIE
jgi:WD40 repeat protein